ncbi:hypothetical protein Micbo1qcDRAFT_220240 [Microdochium bolleyi]|uniref:Alpha/Beta hydrolase protein n=1 Tax=Microdochium bolleyi TaxID=196109 RepID=A0A136J8Z2_9PEZI|nr:hypothetical protein Micbo1qcDRAFT_220240 [Microdochium bolleyi]
MGAAVAAPSPGLLSNLGGVAGGLSGGLTSTLTGTLKNTVTKIEGQLNDAGVAGSALLAQLGDIKPTSTPKSINDVVAIVRRVGGVDPTALLESAVTLVLNGLGPTNLAGVLEQYSDGVNSEHNNNPREPPHPIFPQASGVSSSSEDAPYSFDEAQLRGAIHIPDTFTYGRKPPIILVPATGTKGGFTYQPNVAKLLSKEDYADPVWLNIPGWLLEDVPSNAEYVAYAINYIAGVTSKNVSVVALSQGNLITQWAFSYWPSTRRIVTDYIGISPDYHGTVQFEVMCPKLGLLSCTPSCNQQRYGSEFIKAFRRTGASAFVPTTTIFTATDEIVQPQSGSGASGFLQDERGVGVLNVELQRACPLASPALLNDHISPLWGAPLQALIKDALTHDGPADLARIPNWIAECSKLAADGLTLQDVVNTAFASWLLYPHRVFSEPALPVYAL